MSTGNRGKFTRVLLVEISGDSKVQVERLANLLQDDVKLTATFAQSMMEIFGMDGATADDPIPESPTVNVSSMGEPS